MPDVMGQVIAERREQVKKWGEQTHAPQYWLAILMEELGEAAQATIADTVDWSRYKREMIQVAAVAIAAVEDFEFQSIPNR